MSLSHKQPTLLSECVILRCSRENGEINNCHNLYLRRFRAIVLGRVVSFHIMFQNKDWPKEPHGYF